MAPYLIDVPCGWCGADLRRSGTVVAEAREGIVVEMVPLESQCAEHEEPNCAGVDPW